VWSWRRDPGVKLARSIALTTEARDISEGQRIGKMRTIDVAETRTPATTLGTRPADPLGFFHDNRCSDNATRARAVSHLNPDICVRGIFDPADSGSSSTERITTRSFFVSEPASRMVFEEFAVLLPVEKEPGHLPKCYVLARPESVPRAYSKTGRQILLFHARNLGLHANAAAEARVDLDQLVPRREASNPAMSGRSDWIQILGYSWLVILAAGGIAFVAFF
jgi:hypothetical protein